MPSNQGALFYPIAPKPELSYLIGRLDELDQPLAFIARNAHQDLEQKRGDRAMEGVRE